MPDTENLDRLMFQVEGENDPVIPYPVPVQAGEISFHGRSQVQWILRQMPGDFIDDAPGGGLV